MPGNVTNARVLMPAQDVGFVVALTSAGDAEREVVQLAYVAGTNTTNSIPAFYLLASDSQPGPDAAGVYTLADHAANFIMFGASGAQANVGPFGAWPGHPKVNLAGRFIIPPGYILLAGASDNNMDGTVLYTVITQETSRGA